MIDIHEEAINRLKKGGVFVLFTPDTMKGCMRADEENASKSFEEFFLNARMNYLQSMSGYTEKVEK